MRFAMAIISAHGLTMHVGIEAQQLLTGMCPFVPQAGYFGRIHRPGYCQLTSYRAGFYTLYALTVVTFIIEAAIFQVGLQGTV